ncbi:hypothetical protein [Candidatus Williamhamiltonella defendens]|nr:hypothetical protein [Candidatus Hamiltonella defensa]
MYDFEVGIDKIDLSRIRN